MKVALLSPPWLAPYRPSLQLGTLVAWLRRDLPEVELTALHDHLEVTAWLGYARAKLVADGVLSSWLGEAMSAYLLFPERRPLISRFLDFLVQGKSPAVDLAGDLLLPYKRYVEARARSLDWGAFDLVGLSVSLCQTLSSLLLARAIRRQSRRPLIVLGGPAVSGRMGRSFLSTFPEVDAVVYGEGEQPLVLLLQALAGDKGPAAPLDRIPGVMTRRSPPEQDGCGLELASLDALPVPDYAAYFRTLEALPPPEQAAVREELELPVEGSRGCWWDRRHCRAGASCQFCNLNLQWKRYREKAVGQQLDDLRKLMEHHGTTRFLFVDNVMRQKQATAGELFQRIRDELPRPLQIYMEARASVPPETWRLLHEAGVTHCQVGIESLSTSVLRKIGKGTTAIINLEAMKQMERWGIGNPGNLIYDLPWMTVAEVEEIIATVRLARAYHPLAATRFFLNYGSPYYERFFVRGEPGMALADENYRAWRVLLPPEQERTLFFSERDFEVEVPGMSEAVERLQQACRSWQEHYRATKEQGVACLLACTLAPDRSPGALLVCDRREPGEPVLHTLTGSESEVYAFFDTRRPVAACLAALPHLTAAQVEEQLCSLASCGLLFREGREALSLAIREE